jgi:hypothetical protein
MNTLVVCDAFDFGDNVLFGVEDDFVGTGGLCGGCFGRGGGGADDEGAEMFGDLAEETTGTASCGLNQDNIYWVFVC